MWPQVTSKSVDFTYRGITAGGPDLPAVWAAHVNEYLKPSKQIETSDILFSAAATAMHDILAWALADPGDVFLTSRPVYGRFEFDFATRPQVGMHYVDTDTESCFQKGVVKEFEKAIADLKARGINAKGVVIVNPHNPLGKFSLPRCASKFGHEHSTDADNAGRCYPKDTLIELMKFCCKHKIHLISDEIYACSVFDSGEPDVFPFTSVLSIDAEKYIDSSYLHVLYSLSKTFAAASRNLGSLITRNKLLAAALADTLEYSVPSGASIATSRAILGDTELCAKLIAKNRDNLTKAYRHAVDGLKSIGVAYLPGSNAGFFLWIDLSPYMDHNEKDPDFALAQRILDTGVVLHARAERALTPGWFRFVYTHDPATVTEGLRR
jgi:1-aminocyclopropane-1-carboxylate synthase